MKPANKESKKLPARPHNALGWKGWLGVAGVALISVLVFSPFAVLWGFRVFGPDVCPVGAQDCHTVYGLGQGQLFDEAMTLHDSRNLAFAAVGGEKRLWVPLEDIPQVVSHAWVAVEDRRFFDHGGVDVRGVLRAALRNAIAGGVTEGASTIPMQVVRVVWGDQLTAMSRWQRKAVELATAPKMVDRIGHDRVLEIYLNGIYLGEGVHGIGAAARHWFGVEPRDLAIEEIGLLVGMTKTPGRYNPRRNPELALYRRNLALGQMAEAGVISLAEARQAKSRPLRVLAQPAVDYTRSYATAAVRRELRSVAPQLTGVQGLRVFTTLDQGLQAAAERELSAHVAAIEEGAFGARQTPDQPVEAAFIAMDSKTGAIRATVGGHEFGETELDRSEQTVRQIGSLVKPFLIAAALEAGISGRQAFSTGRVSILVGDEVWSPRDHVDSTTMILREILVNSSNRGAVRLGTTLGVRRFAQAMRNFDLADRIPLYPSSFIGSFEASLERVTGAMAAFENGGFRVQPYLIRRVENASGQVLYEYRRPGAARIMSGATSFRVLDGLRAVIDRGTGWRVRDHLMDVPAAGKTGTTNEARDNWFLGVIPGVSAGVWVGHDRPSPVVVNGSGGRLAAPLWARIMAHSEPTGMEALWSSPTYLTRVSVDARTGLILDPSCAGMQDTVISEAWLDTTLEPTPTGCFDRALTRSLTPVGTVGIVGGAGADPEPKITMPDVLPRAGSGSPSEPASGPGVGQSPSGGSR